MIYAVNDLIHDNDRERIRQTINDNPDDAQLHDPRIVHVCDAEPASRGGGPYYCVWCSTPDMRLRPRRDRHSYGMTFYHAAKPNCITTGVYTGRDTAAC